MANTKIFILTIICIALIILEAQGRLSKYVFIISPSCNVREHKRTWSFGTSGHTLYEKIVFRSTMLGVGMLHCFVVTHEQTKSKRVCFFTHFGFFVQ